MTIMAETGPPPLVKPVTIDGVTYREVHADPDRHGQIGGFLGAFNADGQLLWTLKIYDKPRNPELEGDVQDIFFVQMRRERDGKLLIVNEDNERFRVDVNARTVTEVSARRKKRQFVIPPP